MAKAVTEQATSQSETVIVLEQDDDSELEDDSDWEADSDSEDGFGLLVGRGSGSGLVGGSSPPPPPPPCISPGGQAGPTQLDGRPQPRQSPPPPHPKRPQSLQKTSHFAPGQPSLQVFVGDEPSVNVT